MSKHWVASSMQGLNNRNRKILTCETCGELFQNRPPGRKRFCSTECKSASKAAPQLPSTSTAKENGL
jgi:hypothetical protein